MKFDVVVKRTVVHTCVIKGVEAKDEDTAVETTVDTIIQADGIGYEWEHLDTDYDYEDVEESEDQDEEAEDD